MIKKILKVLVLIIVLFFFCIGFYQSCMWVQAENTRAAVIKIESKRNYEPDLQYYPVYGGPLFLVKPGNRSTLFFMEGFRTQAPAGMYFEYFRELHEKQGVNVIVPVYGLQSSPFDLRNRDWYVQEDLRTVLQIYDAYTSLLPPDHRIVTASMSFGAIPHAAILAKSSRKPAHSFFMSPLNSGLDYRVSGPLIHWLSKQMGLIRHIMPYSMAAPSPVRASVWDIKDREANLKTASAIEANPEESAYYGYMNEVLASWLEKRLLPQVKGRGITVVWGDDDLYFSKQGFTNFAAVLRSAGNTVDIQALTDSGHMLLLDNSRDTMKQMILRRLTGN